MPSLVRPGRLLLALLLAGIVAMDVVVLDAGSLPIVLLAGLLFAVLAVGSFSPFAERRSFLLALLGTQLAGAAVLGYEGYAVLAVALGVTSFATVQRLRAASSRERSSMP